MDVGTGINSQSFSEGTHHSEALYGQWNPTVRQNNLLHELMSITCFRKPGSKSGVISRDPITELMAEHEVSLGWSIIDRHSVASHSSCLDFELAVRCWNSFLELPEIADEHGLRAGILVGVEMIRPLETVTLSPNPATRTSRYQEFMVVVFCVCFSFGAFRRE